MSFGSFSQVFKSKDEQRHAGLNGETVAVVPAYGSTVSAVHQENRSESSGDSQMWRLPDQHHDGLHKLQHQHARLHKERRQNNKKKKVNRNRSRTWTWLWGLQATVQFKYGPKKIDFSTQISALSYKRQSSSEVTFTMVLLCRMKVWKPNQRSFMHNSKATMTNASSSRVAWTCGGVRHTITANCEPWLNVCFIHEEHRWLFARERLLGLLT